MAKGRLNGKLKWIIATTVAALVGTGFMVGEKILFLASVPATVRANVVKDEKDHAAFDEAIRQSEKLFVGIQRDIAQTQKDVNQIVEGQEAMNKKLDDLIMMQLVGPGSGGPNR